MSFASPLPVRRRWALRLLPLPVLLIVLYHLGGFAESPTSGYWTGTAASASIFLAFTAPYAAVSAALDAHRIRSASPRASVRSDLALAWDNIRWPWATATSLQILAAAWSLAPSPGRIEPPIFGIASAWLAILAMHATLGHLLGRSLRAVVAVPLSLLASFVPLAFSWASSFTPSRYLMGLALSTCCDAATEPAPEALLTPILFSGLMTVALLLFTRARGRSRPGSAVSGAVVTALAFASGILLAHDLGPFPAIPRNAHALECVGTNPTICLYPEQRGRPAQADEILREGARRLEDAGLPRPAVITGSLAPRERPDHVNVVVRPELSEEEQWLAFIAGYIGASGTGACLDDAQLSETDRARALLAGLIDAPVDAAHIDIGGDATALAAMPDEEKRRIILSVREAVSACDAGATGGNGP